MGIIETIHSVKCVETKTFKLIRTKHSDVTFIQQIAGWHLQSSSATYLQSLNKLIIPHCLKSCSRYNPPFSRSLSEAQTIPSESISLAPFLTHPLNFVISGGSFFGPLFSLHVGSRTALQK